MSSFSVLDVPFWSLCMDVFLDTMDQRLFTGGKGCRLFCVSSLLISEFGIHWNLAFLYLATRQALQNHSTGGFLSSLLIIKLLPQSSGQWKNCVITAVWVLPFIVGESTPSIFEHDIWIWLIYWHLSINIFSQLRTSLKEVRGKHICILRWHTSSFHQKSKNSPFVVSCNSNTAAVTLLSIDRSAP